MSSPTRREIFALATAMGAACVWANADARPSRTIWREDRDAFPEGVASGDPTHNSVILWTRRPFEDRAASTLHLEVARDPEFREVIATSTVEISIDADWTCRAVVGGLRPRREYWYRFADENGSGSRIGRTLTAPGANDQRPAKFSFMSCQDIHQGAQNAYRRMIFEDERAPAEERLGFVLHLGDFIYEVVWYHEDRPQGMYDRTLTNPFRYPDGQKIRDFHVAATLRDYRAIYRDYLHDPDLQDARARWPFVCIWDNHEFSWRGFQSIQKFGDDLIWAQTRKVFANQAWFEYQPARVVQPSVSLDRFAAPSVVDAEITRFDDDGLGLEANNIAAINSLIAYRTLRWGANLDLIITDNHSWRSNDPTDDPRAGGLSDPSFLYLTPEDATQILDGGRSYNGGSPPDEIHFGAASIANFSKDQRAQSILGRDQKAWFLDELRRSRATWKVWGNSTGILDVRIDLQNLPPDFPAQWAGQGYACMGGGDWSSAFTERAEIYDFVRDQGISGFAVASGDRHSFWAGATGKALPPLQFEPVGVAFITGSVSAPGLAEVLEHRLPQDNPARALFLFDTPHGREPAVNMTLRHGVRASLEYARTGDIDAARALTNPSNSPHLSFVDMSGHGYATMTVTSEFIESEFVCIPRPLQRSAGPDGGPLRYRVRHRAHTWTPGQTPQLSQEVVEGDPWTSI